MFTNVKKIKFKERFRNKKQFNLLKGEKTKQLYKKFTKKGNILNKERIFNNIYH